MRGRLDAHGVNAAGRLAGDTPHLLRALAPLHDRGPLAKLLTRPAPAPYRIESKMIHSREDAVSVSWTLKRSHGGRFVRAPVTHRPQGLHGRASMRCGPRLAAALCLAALSATAGAQGLEIEVGPEPQAIVDGEAAPAAIPDTIALRLILRTLAGVTRSHAKQLLVPMGFEGADADAVISAAVAYRDRVEPLDEQMTLTFSGGAPPSMDALETARADAVRQAETDLLGRLGTGAEFRIAAMLAEVKHGIRVVPVYDPETPAGQTCADMGWWNADDFNECEYQCDDPCQRKQICGGAPCEPWPHYCWRCSSGGGGGGSVGLTCAQMSWYPAQEFDQCTAGCSEPCVKKQWCSTGICEPWPHYCWKCRVPGGGGGGGGTGNLFTYIQASFDGERAWSVATAETDYGAGPQIRVGVETTIRDLVDTASSVHGQIQGFPSATLELSIGATQVKAVEGGDDRDRFEVLHVFRLWVGESIIRWIRERFFTRLGASFICASYIGMDPAGRCQYQVIVPCPVRCPIPITGSIVAIPPAPQPSVCPLFVLTVKPWLKVWGEAIVCSPAGAWLPMPICHCFDERY